MKGTIGDVITDMVRKDNRRHKLLRAADVVIGKLVPGIFWFNS